jgi:hypothetical protein
MNFRVNLAVALAAAFSFACAEKPANIPELEAALQAPPGMQVVGLYRMDVTPVQTPEGVQFAWESVPVGRDGNPATNPPGTVQVKGTFGSVLPWAGPGFVRCAAGVNTISAAVQMTNFAVDRLTNVYAQIVDMAGTTGNVACNPTAAGQFLISDRSRGVWQYPNLAASASATGATAGGTGSATWTLRYVTTTPFRFFFRVVADNNAPVQGFSDPAGPAAPLNWTSTEAANTLVEICSADPGFLVEQPPCPVALSASIPVGPGTGVGPWSFTYAFPASTLVSGNTYFYRVKNVYPVGPSTFFSPWQSFVYNGGGATVPTVAPTAILANDLQAIISWTTVPTVTQSYMYLCQGPCPATLPLAANPVQGNVLFQGAFVDPAPVGVASYVQDVAAFLVTDLLTATYFDPAVAYDVRVFEYDGIVQPTTAAAGATAPFTITPVQVAPTITSQPLTYSAAALTWPVTWTADPLFTVTQVDMCLPDCLNDPFPATAAVAPVLGIYSFDVLTLVTPVTAGQTFELRISNPDLVGTYGVGAIHTVAP